MRGKRSLLGLVLGLIGAIGWAQASFGAGFALYEGSARGNALGGTLVGRADDASAIFYNPAGITQLPGIQIMGGATAIIPSTEVTFAGNPKTYKTQDNVWVPPHGYGSFQLTDKLWFGLGSFSQFGLGTIFDEPHFPGEFSSRKAVIQSVTVNPDIVFKVNDQLSLAAGFDAVWFDLDYAFIRPVIFGGKVFEGPDMHLKGDSWGYGYNFALHYKPCNWVAMGVSYRSEVKQSVDGHVTVGAPVGVTTDANGSIRLPDMLFLGLTFYPIEHLSWEVGGIWTRWSNFSSLSVSTGLGTLTEEKHWKDVWRITTGVEYNVASWLDLRAGYAFDQEPVTKGYEDFLVPANDRHLFSFGPGFHWRNWSLDLSYTYLLIEDRNVKAHDAIFSDYKLENGNAHLIGSSISYKF